MRKMNSESMKVWWTALALFVCVVVSSVTLVNRLNLFLLDDSGAVPLASPEMLGLLEDEAEAIAEGKVITLRNSVERQGYRSYATVSRGRRPSKKYGFEVSDETVIWGTNTIVDIFRVSYENGDQVVTVQSSNEDKLIAPGTENSYVFKLKNTGNVPMYYELDVDAYFTPGDLKIPVTLRLSRYDGKWIAGGVDHYAEVPALDQAQDSSTLGTGKYTYYTLDWKWPFESGNDELDTMLGNLAVDEDLLFTIEIHTVAEAMGGGDTPGGNLPGDDEPGGNQPGGDTPGTTTPGGVTPGGNVPGGEEPGGITPPQTGDTTNLILWIILAVSSANLLALLIFCQMKGKRPKDAEE